MEQNNDPPPDRVLEMAVFDDCSAEKKALVHVKHDLSDLEEYVSAFTKDDCIAKRFSTTELCVSLRKRGYAVYCYIDKYYAVAMTLDGLQFPIYSRGMAEMCCWHTRGKVLHPKHAHYLHNTNCEEAGHALGRLKKARTNWFVEWLCDLTVHELPTVFRRLGAPADLLELSKTMVRRKRHDIWRLPGQDYPMLEYMGMEHFYSNEYHAFDIRFGENAKPVFVYAHFGKHDKITILEKNWVPVRKAFLSKQEGVSRSVADGDEQEKAQ
jgi:hypothetical protein